MVNRKYVSSHAASELIQVRTLHVAEGICQSDEEKIEYKRLIVLLLLLPTPPPLLLLVVFF